MKVTRGRVLALSALAAIFLLSNVALALRCVQLRQELVKANVTIDTLQPRNSFGEAKLRQRFDGLMPITNLGGEAQYAPRAEERTGPGQAGPGSALFLLDLKRRYIRSEQQAEYSLFVFFSPSDCPSCLGEIRNWQHLFVDRTDLRLSVVGIVDRSSAGEATQFLREAGATFPALLDEGSLLRTIYGVSRTPGKLLVDPSGRILLAGGEGQTPEQQQEFEDSVRRTLTPKMEP